MTARPTKLVLRKERRTTGTDHVRLRRFSDTLRKKPLVLDRARVGSGRKNFAMLPHREQVNG